MALSWTQSGSSTSSVYWVERRQGSGAYQFVVQVAGDTRYIDSGLATATSYTYRVRVGFTSGTNSASNEAIAQTLASPAAFPLAAVALWLRAEDVATNDNSPVSIWRDYAQPTRVAQQTNPSDRPVLAAAGLAGKPGVKFGGGTYLELPSVVAGAAAAEIFVVLKSATNSPAANQGLWKFNSTGPTYFPSTTGGVQDAFGSTAVRSSLAPIPDLTIPSLYSVAAATNLWRSRVNGPIKQSLGTNSVSFSGTPWLGRSTGGAAEPFAGTISELIVFNRVLTLDEQKTVRDSLAQKYALTLELPHVPAGLTLTPTNDFDRLLTWSSLTGSENGLEAVYVVERQSSTNSAFLPLQLLPRSATACLDTLDLPEVTYGYRLRVVNDVGSVAGVTLNSPLVDSDGDGVADYLEAILGTNPNNSDGDGDGLPDGWELKYGLNPRSATGRDGAAGDFDNDGLSNLAEYQQGTNPADGSIGEDPLIRLRVHRPN